MDKELIQSAFEVIYEEEFKLLREMYALNIENGFEAFRRPREIPLTESNLPFYFKLSDLYLKHKKLNVARWALADLREDK